MWIRAAFHFSLMRATHGCPQNSHVARRSKDPAFTDTVSCELRIGLQCAQQNTCLVLAIAQCFMRVIMLSQQDLWEQAHAVWRKDSMQYLWCFPPAYLHSVHCAIILFHLMSTFYSCSSKIFTAASGWVTGVFSTNLGEYPIQTLDVQNLSV